MQKVTGTAGGGLGTRCWFHDDDDDDDDDEDDDDDDGDGDDIMFGDHWLTISKSREQN